jgi:hypothetical protein
MAPDVEVEAWLLSVWFVCPGELNTFGLGSTRSLDLNVEALDIMLRRQC